MDLPDWNWTVGVVVAPFGRIGEMKVRLETDFPDRFARLRQIALRMPDGSARMYRVRGTRLHKGQVLLHVDGVDDIDAANQMRGAEVQIPREQAMPLAPGDHYVADIVGLEVVTRGGRVLGRLDRVLPYPAQDLFQVGDILIPAVKEFVLEIDRSNGRIVVDPPDGLLPEEGAAGDTPEARP